jgi:hypothetical protein
MLTQTNKREELSRAWRQRGTWAETVKTYTPPVIKERGSESLTHSLAGDGILTNLTAVAISVYAFAKWSCYAPSIYTMYLSVNFFFLVVVLGFKLRTLSLMGRCFTT